MRRPKPPWPASAYRLDPHAKVEDLSIANRQLVAICRAMAADARLVIMDEPTASLTRHEVDASMRLVADLKRKGICTVFVSHRLDEVLEVAERVTVLRDGAEVGDFRGTGHGRQEARAADDRRRPSRTKPARSTSPKRQPCCR